ncbi:MULTISPECIES: SDR family oxidoreductase [unclassified Rathayibacter]|uniref:SDR family oxidoreductase n=1 Tax=unclassified Rathayibacter TaxID=2609250 RepID=UPI000CE73EA5|nr:MULTISPECIES: SDR family oxidoreductase [unclassified Rathayibacter]PPG81655.1 short-chain dehydrogenase [Rathayibacter sp. AY1E5]PPH28181.1 short-chain dehydrogenase [Rathayibacter sp. AY1C3]PPH62778.1 short-chain dehydrogenase [Rathayibacter sp. AY1D7]PPI34366.1 short-chain dehydrogenase [Rathayibacter sp. AY1B4]
MQIHDSTALVTGANRGIGAEFVRQLRARGARTVYAAARDVSSIAVSEGVVPVALDVTDPERIEELAAELGDLQILVNNAGIAPTVPFLTGDIAEIRRTVETNAFGPLLLTRAFAGHLRRAGGGAVLTVLSVSSFTSFPGAESYSMSKAAAWSATDGLRLALAEQGTQVLGLHMGFVDTDMASWTDAPKSSPEAIVTAALDGLERGDSEVLADDIARSVKAGLALDPAERYGQLLAG